MNFFVSTGLPLASLRVQVNSVGGSPGYQGHLIMTDEWFDEYMFRLVVEKRFVPAATLKLFEQKPTLLPAWDPLFAGEE